MKTLKKILIVLVAIIALLGVIGLFLPSRMHAERTAVIKAPVEVIFNQVADFNNWTSWSPWDKLDPSMKKEFYGEPGKVGHGYKWESSNKEVGKGSQTITAVAPSDSVITDLQFDGMGGSKGFFIFKPVEGGTSVTWGFSCDVGYNVFFRYMGLLMDGMMGKVFDQGLVDLQKACDAAPKTIASVYEVAEVTTPAMKYLSILDSCKTTDIGPTLGKLYGEIGALINEKKATMAGPVFAIYHKYSPDGMTVLEAGVPVDTKIQGKGNIKYIETAEGPAAKLDYYGDYKKAMPAWDAITKYMQDKGHDMKTPPYEVYVNDPMAEKDTAKWHTEIYWPIKSN